LDSHFAFSDIGAPNANQPCPRGLKVLPIVKTETEMMIVKTETMILVHLIVVNTKPNQDKKGRGFNRWSPTLINWKLVFYFGI
jgi:hypothetical protein